MTPHGYLALVLHAHLPYVRHPEYPQFLEEDWFYEAITETYLPLLNVLDQLVQDEVFFALTITLTPTLCAMMRDPLLQERYVAYLKRAIQLADAEVARTKGQERLENMARFYLERLQNCYRQFVFKWDRDLVKAFKQFQDAGFIEIITCAATHGLLPLMANVPEAVRAQILIAHDEYRACFDCDPSGIWLPECGYVEEIGNILAEANIRWFILDAHGLMYAEPRPFAAIYNPCYTPKGPAAFARDRESSKQVWSAAEGYPGDPAYRDFYRDIGFDLPIENLHPVISENQPRKFTGLKYYRVTGKEVPSEQKDLYHRVWAEAAAERHANDFLQNRKTQISNLREHLTIDPIVVTAFDAELFGHWWFEGPEFLNHLIRKCAQDTSVFELVTPGRYLVEHSTLQVVNPSASSWGHKGYWEVWLNQSNSWIYPHLQAATQQMVECAREGQKLMLDTSHPLHRVLCQMARELLLAQSSDWAFLIKTGTAKEFATKTTKDHLMRFQRLAEQWKLQNVDMEFLNNCEWRDALFPNVNWKYYV